MPVVRLSLSIKHFKLEKLSIQLEGVAEFKSVPSIDIQNLEKDFDQAIAAIVFTPILVAIGGVPVEIVPKFNFDRARDLDFREGERRGESQLCRDNEGRGQIRPRERPAHKL